MIQAFFFNFSCGFPTISFLLVSAIIAAFFFIYWSRQKLEILQALFLVFFGFAFLQGASNKDIF